MEILSCFYNKKVKSFLQNVTGRKRSLSGPACSSPAKRKKYLCKYQKAWEAEFSWFSHSDHSINDAYCILCKTLLVLPNSNADSERAFSIIKMIHTEFRSDLNNDTICGLLSCKFNENQCCYEYQPSASVLKSAKSADQLTLATTILVYKFYTSCSPPVL